MDDRYRGAIERLVYCKVPTVEDAEDVLQEIWLCAWENRARLLDQSKQKAWLLGIARHKIADYYRGQAKAPGALPEDYDTPAYGAAHSPVRETLAALQPRHRALLERAYLHGCSLRDIACESGLPLGTVKSRLHTAREAFRQEYEKGEMTMKKTFPETMPALSIAPSKLPVFSVDCLELGGWFFRAKEGEDCEWAEYDMPGLDGRAASELTNLHRVKHTGKTNVHGVEGLAFETEDHYLPDNITIKRWFAVQRTESHVRWIAEAHEKDGAIALSTFLDDDFLRNWGSGEDNIGDRIHRPATCFDGRFTVRIGGAAHDTVRLRKFGNRFPTLQHRYLNAEGRTVLFQEFAPREVLLAREYTLDERAETLEHEGKVYLHWFDCIERFVL